MEIKIVLNIQYRQKSIKLGHELYPKNMEVEKYYISKVDLKPETIYCHHDKMGELHIEEHSHLKAQLIYTEGGNVYIKLNDTTYFLPARHFMWIPPHTRHSIYTSSEDAVMRNLYFPICNGDENFYTNTAIYPLTDLLYQMLLLTSKWNGDLFPQQREFRILEGIKAMLPEICGHESEFTLPIAKSEKLIKILNFISENLHLNIKYPQLAEKFGTSTRTLNRLFHQEIGISYIQYLTVLKMIRAVELLSEKNHTVSEVALLVGYESVQTFSNTFLKHVGKRPKDYLL